MHPLVARALLDAGRREGDPALPWATAARPWCARWLSAVLRDCGVDVPRAAEWQVRALLRWLGSRGWSVPHTSALFLPGDVIAKMRPGGMHVALVTADGGGARVQVVSGNTPRRGYHGVVWVAEGTMRRGEIVGAARVTWAARPMPG